MPWGIYTVNGVWIGSRRYPLGLSLRSLTIKFGWASARREARYSVMNMEKARSAVCLPPLRDRFDPPSASFGTDLEDKTFRT